MNWNDFWLSKWVEGKINFHQEQVESFLANHFPKLGPQTVFVPLCGKSKDLLYFSNAGHTVIGVELSELACRAFFAESNIAFTAQKSGDFMVFESVRSERPHFGFIKIYCGDFFKLTSALLGRVNWIYDRAALIALPPEVRSEYCEHLFSLFKDQAVSIFLITFEYDPSLRDGPPFSVDANEVTQLYGDHFEINEIISENDHTSMNTHKGVRPIDVCEHVFLLKSK
jgi:thiopurine S-methyltransferase